VKTVDTYERKFKKSFIAKRSVATMPPSYSTAGSTKNSLHISVAAAKGFVMERHNLINIACYRSTSLCAIA
jgi:hypothetical protein